MNGLITANGYSYSTKILKVLHRLVSPSEVVSIYHVMLCNSVG